MPWDAITSIATVISTIAFILTALYVRAELKAMERDRYLAVTSELYNVWQGKEFMDAQLWLLHRLTETTWTDFVKAHRGDAGEAAFYRVGSFYDRVGTLVRLGLVNQDEILVTVGAHAIKVWQKIQELVREARRIEHTALFADFEGVLPSCHECYVPMLGAGGRVNSASGAPPSEDAASAVDRIGVADLKQRLDQGEPLTVLDVRQPLQVQADPRTLPNAMWLPPDDVDKRYEELPREREIVVFCA